MPGTEPIEGLGLAFQCGERRRIGSVQTPSDVRAGPPSMGIALPKTEEPQRGAVGEAPALLALPFEMLVAPPRGSRTRSVAPSPRVLRTSTLKTAQP